MNEKGQSDDEEGAIQSDIRSSLVSNDDELISFFNLPVDNILRNTSAGVLITNQEDKLVWINERMLENPNLGTSIKAVSQFLLNKPAMDVLAYFKEFILPPEVFSARIKEFLLNRIPRQGERFVLKNGGDIRLDYTPIFQSGVYHGAIWGIFNLTEATTTGSPHNNVVNLEFGRILKHLQISWCEVTEKGNILYASPSFCRRIGYTINELVDTNFLDLCRTGKSQLMRYLKGEYPMVSNKTVSFELELGTKDYIKWFQCITSDYLKKFSVHSGYLFFMSEITEQKNIQNELEKAKIVAEKAQLAQQQFFANMSHDIRTPLNTIIGMLHLMADTPLNKEQKDFIRMILGESNILMNLLSNVLDFSRIESGRQEVHLAEFNLRAALNSLLKTFTFKIKEKDISLNLAIDPDIKNLVIGDNALLSQILTNLFSNAIKFTKKGDITFQVKKIKESGRNVWIEFTVKDTGIGVPPDKLKSIFEDFVQGNEKIRNDYGGSGLGLFIVKRLVDILGGEVRVTSEEGVGSAFIFSLPFVKTDKPAIIRVEKRINPDYLRRVKARILIVEDNAMNLKYIETILKRLNLDYDSAEDGYSALDKGLNQYYDLILMDLRLPGMNGFEVTEGLRADGNLNAATPIILVTAEAFQETMDRARKVGANEVFLKPYTPHGFLALLDKYLVEEDTSMEEHEKDSFRFDEKLNGDYLQKLYSGNCTYALSLFDLFLDSLKEEWQEIRGYMENEDWEQLIAIIHKIKPNFSMVGLTEVTKTIQLAYDKLKKQDYRAAVSLLRSVEANLPEYTELISREKLRLQEYININQTLNMDI